MNGQTDAILEVSGLETRFASERRAVRSVDGVGFTVRRGETLAIVGESGSGKSVLVGESSSGKTTVGPLLLRLADPTAGRILFDGKDITTLSQRELLPLRRRMQMIFQDPFASLNTRLKVAQSLKEALAIHSIGTRRERPDRAAQAMKRVGLSTGQMNRYPHEFSGGQRRRIVIARALALEPDLVIADEPVSALDVSIQAQIINLLSELQRDLSLAILFVSHDLSVVEYFCDEVVVMYLGRVMEHGPADRIFSQAHHPYTRALLSASPDADPNAKHQRIVLEGDIPSPSNPPQGCVFHTRCPHALNACMAARPAERLIGPGHRSACIRDDIPR